MRVDAWGSLPHYIRHILPVHRALPDDVRGDFYVTPRMVSKGHAPPGAKIGLPPRSDPGPVLVAGAQDMLPIRRPIILAEHGAGQTYAGVSNPSYAGGRGRERVVLFLCPSERVAEINRAAYPSTPAVAVGCPAMDEWQAKRPAPLEPGLVAVTFHWHGSMVPEMASAQPHYRLAVEALAGERPVLGHAHPRAWTATRPWYRRAGIECTPDPGEVFRRASVLVADNTSLIFEFASLGRPVVLLNLPSFRREVDHGLRFWSEATVGLQVDDPAALGETVALALTDPPATAQARESALGRVYAYRDGHAAERAAVAICELLDGGTIRP